jgi:hypothetical protein
MPPTRDPITTGSTAQNWTALEGLQILEILSSGEHGLTSAEAADRLAEAGPNVLPSAPKPGAVIIYAHQFKNPLVYLLQILPAMVRLDLMTVIDPRQRKRRPPESQPGRRGRGSGQVLFDQRLGVRRTLRRRRGCPGARR